MRPLHERLNSLAGFFPDSRFAFSFTPPFFMTWIQIKPRPRTSCCRSRPKFSQFYAVGDFCKTHTGNLKCHTTFYNKLQRSSLFFLTVKIFLLSNMANKWKNSEIPRVLFSFQDKHERAQAVTWEIKVSLLLFQSTPTLCLFGGCKWRLSSGAHGHFSAPTKSRRLPVPVPVPAKRPQKPKRSKHLARRSATVSFHAFIHPLPSTWRERKKKSVVYSLTF